MIPKLREQFNEVFTPEKYARLRELIIKEAHAPCPFRLSESPIFLSQDFLEKLNSAAQSLIDQLDSFSEKELKEAIPKGSLVPNDHDKYHFLAIDFGICQNDHGTYEPQLIEMQAFPSLFAFQRQYEESLKAIYPFLNQFDPVYEKEEYFKLLKKIIVGKEDPKNVILLELFPEKQKTAIDFALTERYLGIPTIGYTELIKEGNKLFYQNKNGEIIRVKRIYNRIIFDELERYPDLKAPFKFTDEVDVTWVTHPNWFFKISKYILPKLQHEFVPPSYYASDFPENADPEDYVLKPLFSFAGTGINLHPTREDIENLRDKKNFLLQKKVHYADAFKDPNGEYSKAEIRLLFARPDDAEKATLLCNLVRMTKAEMVNVDFNKKDAIWIGSSMAFFEKD